MLASRPLPPPRARPCRASGHPCTRRQGEEADNFYVIEAGRFEATKLPSGGLDGPAVRVATYEARGSFGEMALMYNCPRAASVTGEPGPPRAARVWELGREREGAAEGRERPRPAG